MVSWLRGLHILDNAAYAVIAGPRFRDGCSFAKNTDDHRPTIEFFGGGGTPGAGELLIILLDNDA